MNKKKLGQFFTTNVDYILSGFENVVNNKSVLDPFAGNGDLLDWAIKNKALSVIGFDIDKTLFSNKISFNDGLKVIPKSDFNLTNPPYLAKNKMTKDQKNEYMNNSYEDFYLLAISKIIESDPYEGIIIIPINFFSAENSDHLRKVFLKKYKISNVNYFKNKVFEDTTYNVVSFHYIKKELPSVDQKIEITFFPEKNKKTFIIEENFNYRIAGKELNKITSIKSLKSTRLTEDIIHKNVGTNKIKALFNDKNNFCEYFVNDDLFNKIQNNCILLNCIDTNANESAWIKAENIKKLNQDCLVGKNSSRNIAYIIFDDILLKDQEKIISLFNSTLNDLRKKYNSLFLTNFRDNDRKRISFDFCYKLITFCYESIKN